MAHLDLDPGDRPGGVRHADTQDRPLWDVLRGAGEQNAQPPQGAVQDGPLAWRSQALGIGDKYTYGVAPAAGGAATSTS